MSLDDYTVRLGLETDVKQTVVLIEGNYSPDETMFKAYAQCNRSTYKINLDQTLVASTTRLLTYAILPKMPFVVAVNKRTNCIDGALVLLTKEYPNLLRLPDTNAPDPNPLSTLQRIVYHLWQIRDWAMLRSQFTKALKMLNVAFLTVHREHRGEGLAVTLLEYGQIWAQQQGYDVMHGIFTSAAAKKAAIRSEMHCVYEVDIRSLRGSRGEQVFADAGENSLVAVMAVDFHVDTDSDSTTTDVL